MGSSESINRVALYLRASTEHQNYSTRHQEATLQTYAAKHQLEIVRVYKDEGRSGLSLDGRKGLSRLLGDVVRGDADFGTILVYDVSRWGRFQDIDESAHYEFLCRQAGICVAYCAETFVNDGSPLSAVLKGLKRAMAAEYSRELSTKVLSAQCRLAHEGFKQGGTAGYGLRRLAKSADGSPLQILSRGERKIHLTDRVVLVRGTDEEIAVINRIYDLYIEQGMSDLGIARLLNLEGVPSEQKRWTNYQVRTILTNIKYTGTLAFNKSTQRLRTTPRKNNVGDWVRHDGAFTPIVTPQRFVMAQQERHRRLKCWTNQEMLEALRTLHREHGKVTAELIESRSLPAFRVFSRRFRGLAGAVYAAGIDPSTSISRTKFSRARQTYSMRQMIRDFFEASASAGADVKRLSKQVFELNGVRVRLLCTTIRNDRSLPRWDVPIYHPLDPEFVIFAPISDLGSEGKNLYLIPTSDFPGMKIIIPSIRSLPFYAKYAYGSMRQIFGLEPRRPDLSSSPPAERHRLKKFRCPT